MIKVSFSGQYLGCSGYITSFQDSDDTSWTTTLFDPRAYGRVFIVGEIDECFSIWHDNVSGNKYALLKKSPDNSSRDGYVMITICTEDYIIADGKDVRTCLRYLYNLFCAQPFTSPQNLYEECFESVRNLTNNISLSKSKKEANGYKRGDAIRYFTSENELDIILQFPIQDDSKPFEHIFILPANPTLNLTDDYKLLSSQVKKSYKIFKPYPDGVSPDKDIVCEGDTLTITYNKKGYKSVSKIVNINGYSNNYLSYLGIDIFLKDISQSGMTLFKAIRVVCKSINGVEINNHNVTYIDGSDIQSFQDGEVIFSQANEKYECVFSAKGYENCEVTIDSSDFAIGTKELLFTPKSELIQIYFDNHGKTISGEVSIKTDSPIYKILIDASQNIKPINNYKFPKPSKRDNNNHLKLKSNWRDKILYVLKKIRLSIFFLAVAYTLYALYSYLDLERAPWPFY